ncbi:MAG TPA: NHL repeat-containing protein [Verrucomicrobiae bacterium]|jgi:serine/threonine-protein kinase
MGKKLLIIVWITVLTAVIVLVPIGAGAQNLLESDSGSGNIYLFTTNGTQSVYAAGLSSPYGLAFNSGGKLFEADYGSSNIFQFTDGARIYFSSGFIPVGLAIDTNGNVFVTDTSNGRIIKYTPTGTFNPFASGLIYPSGLAFDSAGNLYEADQGNAIGSGHVYKFTPAGTRSTLFSNSLGDPVGLAIDRSNSVFVADFANNAIYKYTTNGVFSTFVSSGLDEPAGLAFDDAGNLYEADYGSGNIFKFNSKGVLLGTFASNLDSPTYLAFEPPAPALNISQTGNQSVLYWPAVGASYTLQMSTNLSSANWVTVTNGIQITGFAITNSSPNAFFRIVSP